MNKLMIAALSLSLLSGTATLFAQNTSTGSTDTGSMKSTMKKKHHKKGTMSDTMGGSTSSSTSTSTSK